MNRVILKAFPAVHALIQSSGNRKADPSQYTTNLDFYGIMHNLLIYFYSDRVVSEPSFASMWGREKGFGWFQIFEVTIDFLKKIFLLFFRNDNKHSKLHTLE